jgi:hypothetical protein
LYYISREKINAKGGEYIYADSAEMMKVHKALDSKSVELQSKIQVGLLKTEK